MDKNLIIGICLGVIGLASIGQTLLVFYVLRNRPRYRRKNF